MVWLCALLVLLASCSTTKHIPDDDQLFIGLTKIEYQEDSARQSLLPSLSALRSPQAVHYRQTQEEIEAALATAPNGALFGSSRFRSPLPIGLWIWNYTYGSSGRFKQWLGRSFATPPVLMSQVNPALRAQVARSVLRKNGYLHGDVDYAEVPRKNPRKMKIGYTVKPGPLFTVDTLEYVGFPPAIQTLIDSTRSEARIASGSPFAVSSLDAERTRLAQLLRNSGYYYYQPGYASYLADTTWSKGQGTGGKGQGARGEVALRLQMADSLPQDVLRKWHIGRMSISLRRTARDQPTDSAERRHLKVLFSGKRPPLRPRVILSNMKLRPRQLFCYDDYYQSLQALSSSGVFSSVDFQFAPRNPDTLDLALNCVFDKPYDVYFETNIAARTIGRMGPEAKVGFTRRNLFRGAEQLDVNLHGSYEWDVKEGLSDNNSYQYGVDASIEFPRILLPRFRRERVGERRPRRRQFYATPWTIAKVSTDVVRRPDYYKMHIVSGEWTYRWQNSAQSTHEMSPLTLKYQYMNTVTQKFRDIVSKNPYLMASMNDYFIPKMRYTYTYVSPATRKNPLRWELNLEEAGNVVALWHLAGGHRWNEKDKTLFKNPYSQYLKAETSLTKTWQLSPHSQLVGHLAAGVLWWFGNSSDFPYTEGYYVGGANSLRAFPVRSIGPAACPNLGNRQVSYLIQTGNSKFEANLEYRTQLFGNLYGAVFLDAGNIWSTRNWTIDPVQYAQAYGPLTPEVEEQLAVWNFIFADCKFHPHKFLRQLATGTGVGLRYDLQFLVLRVDWGFGLHVPYLTEKSGYFNIDRFSDMHTLHIAIGYPF